MCIVYGQKAHVHKISPLKGMLDIRCKMMYEKYLKLLVHVARSKIEVFAYLKGMSMEQNIKGGKKHSYPGLAEVMI
jgi:hypothetical protein